MKTNRWMGTLECFRSKEQAESVLLVSGNVSLIRIIVAWMNMPIRRRKRLSPFPEGNDEQKWHWLWENAIFSMEELARRQPFADTQLEQKLNALIANRVLYPDGSVHSYVERLLREQILKMYPSTGKRLHKAASN